MAKAKPTERKMKPAMDPISRERQLTSLAVDLAEKQLREGTASASVINHYLKIASSRDAIERDILEKQAQLIAAKADSITSNKESENLAREAIEAMRSYSQTPGEK